MGRLHNWIKEKFKSYCYTEQYTKCDLCEYLDKCLHEKWMIDVRTLLDKEPHYSLGLGEECYKEASEREWSKNTR